MTASHDGMAFLWDAFTGARVCSKLVHTGGVSSLDIAEDASKMASVGAERQLKVWTIDFSAVARPQVKFFCLFFLNFALFSTLFYLSLAFAVNASVKREKFTSTSY